MTRNELFNVPFSKAQSAMSRTSSTQIASAFIDARYSKDVIAACCRVVTEEVMKEIAAKKNVLLVLIAKPTMPT